MYDSISKLNINPQTENIKTVETIEESETSTTQELNVPDEIVSENIEQVDEIETITAEPVNEIIKEVLEEIKIVVEEKTVATFFTETLTEKKSNLINIPQTELSLHQKISGNKHNDINERINESRVESLKAAIGLNKKIAFVNDLFKENTVEYAKAIDKLNISTDLNEAMRFFNELKHQYSWDNDNENVIELEQLIQKRFR